MKPLQLMCLCGLLAIITLARAPAQPGRLRCEYLDHPLAVEARVPRLSWLMETSGELRRGLRQTAWRVLVASTPERLARDEGDLWDSGKVASDQSIQIGYAGKPLPSRQRCHWKVMVWAQDGKPSAWSAPAEWRMGLLKPEDWHGKWITIKTAEGLAHPWLRRTFDLQAVPGEARIYINTPSHYELYVNGKKVGGDVLAPAHVQLSKRFHYNVRDLSGLLRPGKNCVALWMGPGWYQPRYGNPYHAPIVRAQLEFADNGGTTLIPTDSTWRVADSCLSQVGSWSHNNFGGERWDARRYVEGWNQPDFADSGWAEAIEIPAPAVAHSWQALPGSRLGTPEPPQRIYPHDGKWVVDFGKNFTGWMRCRVTGLKPGQEITIDYADLDPARRHLMHVPNKANGFQTFNQQDSYVAGHQTEDVFCSKFNHHGFRYAVITGLSRAPEVGDAAAMMITTDLDQAGEFSCSNELFNRIHEVTVRSCLTQTPAGVLGGGETREHLGYGDGGSFLTGFLYNLQSDAFFQKWLGDWRDNQRDDGFLGHVAPEFYPAGGGPSWCGQASELVRRLHLYYGDRRAVEDSHAALRRFLEFLERQTKDDLLTYYNPYKPGIYQKWYFLGDWTPPGTDPDKDQFQFETAEQRGFFNNCYRVLLWEQLAADAEILGDSAAAGHCRERLAVLRPLVHKTYFDAEKKTYKCNRQAYLVIALRSGIVPAELRPEIFRQLEEDIVVTRNGHLDTGLQGTFMLLDLLIRENRPGLAARVMNQTTYPGWGFLLNERGVTTWPETWSGWGSQIIQVVGTPGAWFYEGLAGIRPDWQQPGFKHFLIRPGVVAQAAWVKCRYASPYGDIVSNWRREGRQLTMDVTVPPNSSATVYVPAADPAGVTESGKPAAAAEGVTFLRMEDDLAVYQAGAGRYVFTGSIALAGELQEGDPGPPPSAAETRVAFPGANEMSFRQLPAGRFMMGSPGGEKDGDPDEKPVHEVVITQSFHLAVCEVTCAQWKSVMGALPASAGDDPDAPVAGVTWDDCQMFIGKLRSLGIGTFRLPTEAEWEYACRAGHTERFYWGDDPGCALADDYVWHKGNAGNRAHPVGSKKANAWGLHDMSGNVWEWCQDWYGPYPAGRQVDPGGPPTGTAHVFRGNGWHWGPKYCRSANRYYNEQGHAIGLRLVLEQSTEPVP